VWTWGLEFFLIYLSPGVWIWGGKEVTMSLNLVKKLTMISNFVWSEMRGRFCSTKKWWDKAVCSLFNDVFHRLSVVWRGDKWMMNCNGCIRKESWPSFRTLYQHLPEGTEEKHEKPQDSRSPGLDLNPGPPKYEAWLLTTTLVARL
jgi:hypothetical protein